MTRSSGSELSAQVLLRSRSGRVVTGDTAITAANIGEYAPDPDEAAAAAQAFARAGFAVGPVVGISFAATAPAATFESVFGVRLHVDPGGGVEVRREGGTAGTELPLDRLPPEVPAGVVTAVAFSPPAEPFTSATMR